MRTANPILNDRVFTGERGLAGDQIMTLEGTINKTLLALAITVGVAAWSWSDPFFARYMLLFVIGGLIVGLAISFKPTWAPALTPIYAVLEGGFLGSVSNMYNEVYGGIVSQAVLFTFLTLFGLLAIYRTGVIKVTDRMRAIVGGAVGAIFLGYLIAFILSFFGFNLDFIYGNGPISIGLSVLIVGIASFSLVIHFDSIERATRSGATPKYMEWYAAFGLLVTLIWLYLEILRLLAKLQSRD